MILITGAGGKTGNAVIRFLNKNGAEIRALVHRPERRAELHALGVSDVQVGDMRLKSILERAMEGVKAVYHICPNMSPDEFPIGQSILAAAKSHGVEKFVYHSVLHPQVQKMTHHWNKNLVEEAIFASGLNFTILQPTAYMQNMTAYIPRIHSEGVYAPPYSPETRISQVDLEDVAEVAARVLLEPGYDHAVYELVGTPALSQAEVAEMIGDRINRTIRVEAFPRDTWEQNARRSGMDEYAVQSLLKMFEYYESYGMAGNPQVLTWLLNRKPVTFTQFIDRILANDLKKN